MLPTFRERYDLVLVDVTQKNRRSEDIKDIWDKTIARASNFHVQKKGRGVR
jgi:hypothetical protein